MQKVMCVCKYWNIKWGLNIGVAIQKIVIKEICTRLNWGKINEFKVAPAAREANPATKSNRGKLGSRTPEAASPATDKSMSGKRADGLSKNEVSFAGTLSNSDSRPSEWFVKHIGSPEYKFGSFGLNLIGPTSLYTFDGAAAAIVTLSPSRAGRSAVSVANFWVRATPEGVCTYREWQRKKLVTGTREQRELYVNCLKNFG